MSYANNSGADQPVHPCINPQVFIRIITFLWEGGGCLLEAIVLEMARKNVQKVQFLVNIHVVAILLLRKRNN